MARSRSRIKIHQQLLHAAQRPRPLKERKTEIEHAEPVALLPDARFDVGEKTCIQRVRERVVPQIRLRQELPPDHADILVLAAVPEDAEIVPHTLAAGRLEVAVAVPEHQKMVVERRVDVFGSVMPGQQLPRLQRKADLPRHIRNLLVPHGRLHDFPFVHDPGLLS